MLWELRYDQVKHVKSSQWEMTDLLKAAKGLKSKQSIDPAGLVSELFKPGVMGQDMAVGLLDMINGIKSNLFIPEIIQLANITSIYKNNRRSRLDISNGPVHFPGGTQDN